MKNKHVALFVLALILIAGGLFLWLTKASNNGGAALFNAPVASLSCPASGYKYSNQWGNYGTGNSQFAAPGYVAVNSSGEVYIFDSSNNRVQKFDSNGQYILQWGTQGTGNGQFQAPGFLIGDLKGGIAVDSTGNVYVVDTGNNRVQKFNSQGGYVTQWGTLGTGNGQFSGPGGIAVDSTGNVYVVDRFNNRIQKFTSSGSYVSQFSTGSSAQGQFSNPTGVDNDVVIGVSGNIYVTTLSGYGVKKFTSSGQYVSQIGSQGYTGDGKFMDPLGIDIDAHGNIYVVDGYQERVQKFDQNGNYLAQWGTNGTGNGQFRSPVGIAISSLGNLYVSDISNNRIQKFSPCAQIQALPVNTLKPDLIVQDFNWMPNPTKVRVITNPINEPTPNTNFQIKATIKNIGPVDAVLPVGTQISFSKGGVVYGAQQLINPVTIPSGQTYDVTIYQSTTPNIRDTAGTFNIAVSVDDYAGGAPYSAPANRVVESNEANNSLTKSLTITP